MSNYKLIPISKNARRGLKYYFVNEKPNESPVDLYSTLVSPGDLCFDIGANVGDNTKRLLDLNAKVIAVEPQPDCVSVIKSRCGNNSNLIIIQKALGDVECEMEMAINSASVLSSLSSEWLSAVQTSGRHAKYCWPDWDKKQLVQVTTLDRLIEQYGLPTFIKIDVEGFESRVLKGLSIPVGALSFEFTSENCGDAIKCIGILCQLGDIRLNYALNWSQQLVLETWVEPKEMLDIISATLSQSGIDVFGDIYVKFAGKS